MRRAVPAVGARLSASCKPLPARNSARSAGGSARHRHLSSGSSSGRTDGFDEALPKGDFVAPMFMAGIFGFSWCMAEEDRIKPLAEKVDINTDPSKNPTPNQVFHHMWPYVAGSLATLFDSVACRFAATKDMDWLCTVALNDDTNAAVALSLLVPPAENSPAFVRAICERPGVLRRTKEIVHIYKTLPREQHDDVVVNACIIAAKVATMPELREQGLGVADFVWMMPADKAHLYTQYGIEGLAALWKQDTKTFLCSGGVLRLYELVEGPALRPKKSESSAVIQLLAHRMVNEFFAQKDALLAEAAVAEAKLAREAQLAGPAKPRKTLWQAAGVVRGETELEVAARQRNEQLEAVRGGTAALTAFQPRQAMLTLEQYQSPITVLTAGVFGAIYGGMRGYGRAWFSDVTPSVCREVAARVSGRAALGAMLLAGFFEAAPALKKQALQQMGKTAVTDFSQPGALEQLVAIDCMYLATISLLNFAFPYILVPVALNPSQILLPPSQPEAAADQKV